LARAAFVASASPTPSSLRDSSFAH
jgi:hypothetical protein